MTALTLRLQLAQIADIQAALDALRTDITLRLKETQQQCIAATETDIEGSGMSLSSGC